MAERERLGRIAYRGFFSPDIDPPWESSSDLIRENTTAWAENVAAAVRGEGRASAADAATVERLRAVARAARDRNCGRMEWSVLNWNTPAIESYQSLGAVPLDEWTTYRMDEAAIATLAE